MSMTRKDFQAVADVIAYNRRQTGLAPGQPNSDDVLAGYIVALNDTAFLLADVMARANAAFDRARFLKACGVPA